MGIYLGIDIGGMSIKIGLITEDFKLLSKQAIETKANTETPYNIISRMMESCEKVLTANQYSFSDVIAIGVGAPGTILNKTGIYSFTGNLPFRNYPFRKKMQEFYEGPIYLGNDANMAALAECRIGVGKGSSNICMITIGTGIGSGVVINNRIYTGFNEAGTEIGHMAINIGGEYCTCGRYGCLEAYVAAPALIKQTQNAILENPESILAQVAGNSKVTGKTVFEAVDRGCPVAEEVFKQYAYYLRIGMANVINIFMPEMIILGGGISNEGNRLINSFKQGSIDDSFLTSSVPNTEFKIATLGNDAGMLGAAIFAADCLQDGILF